MQTGIKKICGQFLDSNDFSTHQFRRIFNIAIRGFENEFNLDVCGYFKTVLLDLSPNKTVPFPCDYINYSKIGIVNGAGEFVTLKRNDQLSAYHSAYYTNVDRNAGVPSINSFGTPFGINNLSYNNLYYFNFWNSGTSFNLYGLDSGTATLGTYKIDMANNLIILNPEFIYQQILLEYLSDGYDEEQDDYYIDSRAAEAMICWIRWQSSIDQPKKYSSNTVLMYKKEYFNEKRKAKVRINSFNLSEMNDIIRRGSKLTPKA